MARSSNIDEVVAWLESFVNGFNFLLPGMDSSLGRDLAHVVAGRIGERAAQQSRGADPAPWDRVSARYLPRKRRKYGWPEADGKPNYATGQMLSHASLMGETRVSDQLVEMHYGTGDPPRRTASPTDGRTPRETAADERATDREKAGYAHELGRDFYEIDDDIEAAVIEEADQHLAEYLRTHG